MTSIPVCAVPAKRLRIAFVAGTLALLSTGGCAMTATKLNMIEQWARIFSGFAIPVIVALIAYRLQAVVSRRSVAKDYVQLAVSILSDPEKASPLRDWAADLLNEYSPVDLPDTLKKELVEGTTSLPWNFYRAGTAIVRIWPPSVWAWSGGGDLPDMDGARLTEATLRRIKGIDRLRVVAEKDGVEYSSILSVPDPEYRNLLFSVLQASVGMTIGEISSNLQVD
jgi:hypothetical protein